MSTPDANLEAVPDIMMMPNSCLLEKRATRTPSSLAFRTQYAPCRPHQEADDIPRLQRPLTVAWVLAVIATRGLLAGRFTG